VAELRLDRDAGIDPDHGEVLWVEEDRVGELADPGAGRVARLGAGAGVPAAALFARSRERSVRSCSGPSAAEGPAERNQEEDALVACMR
jgi:hypothetical protein